MLFRLHQLRFVPSAMAVLLLPMQVGCHSPLAQTAPRNAMPNTSPTCAGRFSLQLPSPIKQGMNPNVFNSVEFTWQELQGETVDKLWQENVHKLQTEQGTTAQGGRIVKNYVLDGRHAVFYRYAPTADSSHTLETWTVYGDKVLKSEFDGNKADLAGIEQLTLNVLHHFVPSTSEGVPSPGLGFCIQGGTIQLPPQEGEQVTSFWNLPLNYELELRSAVVSAPYTIKLIEEAKKTVAASKTTPGSHYTLTRAANRTVLGMEGQETIQHYHNDPSPTNFYNAIFSFGGVKDKGSKPGWRLTLTAYDHADRKVDEAVFISTWEDILHTMSMRLQD